jgi:hypothetical protein
VVVLPIIIRPGRCYLDIFELAFSLMVKMLASVYFAPGLDGKSQHTSSAAPKK